MHTAHRRVQLRVIELCSAQIEDARSSAPPIGVAHAQGSRSQPLQNALTVSILVRVTLQHCNTVYRVIYWVNLYKMLFHSSPCNTVTLHNTLTLSILLQRLRNPNWADFGVNVGYRSVVMHKNSLTPASMGMGMNHTWAFHTLGLWVQALSRKQPGKTAQIVEFWIQAFFCARYYRVFSGKLSKLLGKNVTL